MNTKDTDIAVVGMSCFFPGAPNIEKFWYNLSHGVDSVIDAPPNRIDPRFIAQAGEKPAIDRFYFNKGGFIDPILVDPTRYGILPIAAAGLDPEQLLSLKLVEEALEDAGVFEKNLSLEKCSFILGKGNYSGFAALKISSMFYFTSQLETLVKYLFPQLPTEEVLRISKEYQQSRGRYQADTAAGSMSNMVVAYASNRFNMRGPTYTIDAACASSLLAVDLSMQLLLSGQCDIALAGGMHIYQNEMFWSVFNTINAASYRGVCAPFSVHADGVVIGEGAGIVVLKKLSKAIADNDKIYAIIKSACSSSDGSGVSVMAPNTDGQVNCLVQAWKNSGMDPLKVGYVEAHGTATKAGDLAETKTLQTFFGDKTKPLALLGSVKSNIGHAMPAAGIAGFIKTVLSLYHRQIVPTLHCEEPSKELLETRFRPAQKLIEWDGVQYPLVGAINAFGFGGANTHAILTPYEKKDVVTGKRVESTTAVIAISAATRQALLDKLDKGEYTLEEGDYRVVIFNPTKERISKARLLIEKDRPWKGRMDIWFSNKPLLTDGGKLAFMFTGFDSAVHYDVQSIADYFNLNYDKMTETINPIIGETFNQYYRSFMIDEALKKAGVIPDLYFGHSVGEWHAASAAGMIPKSCVEKFLQNSFDPEFSYIIDIPYIAIGCGYDKIRDFCEGNSDLYLANDNCPNQILMAGTRQGANQLMEELKRRQIYYQELPFQSANHTPFSPIKRKIVAAMAPYIEIHPNHYPMFSATSLEEYPSDIDSLFKLSVRHLEETVHFRELVLKLYEQEKVRMFIQVGAGNLIGFVDDTLSGKEFSAIPTAVADKTGIEQFKRVMALLFIEGKPLNKEFMGIAEQTAGTKSKVATRPTGAGKQILLQSHTTLTEEFPLFKATVDNMIHQEAAELAESQTPLAGVHLKSGSPLLQSVSENLRELAEKEAEVLRKLQEQKKTSVVPSAPAPPLDNTVKPTINPALKIAPLVAKEEPKRTGTTVEFPIHITLDDHPYLKDHIIIRQPKDWPIQADLNPVVPMTMLFEIFCEHVLKMAPGKKIVKMNAGRVIGWIPVEKPFDGTIIATWKSETEVHMNLPRHGFIDITIGDEFPSAPAEDMIEPDLGEMIFPEVLAGLDVPDVYDLFLFHGPCYHSLVTLKQVYSRGLQTLVKKAEGKGSVMDNCSALLGLFTYQITDQASTFPLSMDEVRYYQDFDDQAGLFEYTLIFRSIDEEEVIGDIILKRDGKLWCRVSGWHNKRFLFSRQLLTAIMKPEKGAVMSTEIAPDVYAFDDTIVKNAAMWDFAFKRFLNQEEKKAHAGMYLNRAKEFIISRIALKDAVVKYLRSRRILMGIFPIEISVGKDSNGRPYVYGRPEFERLHVSIAHKGATAVAIAAEHPVGIDLELIEPHDDAFVQSVCTEREIALLKEHENTEWLTRIWVAKEAYGKMLGVGLQGNPQQYEVITIDGEDLKIKNTVIRTMKYKEKFIVGWTLTENN